MSRRDLKKLRRLFNCELSDRLVAEGKLKIEFDRASGKLSLYTNLHSDCRAIFADIEDSRLRAVLFTRVRNPDFNCFRSDIVVSFVADRGIGCETGGGRRGVETIGCFEVTSDRARQCNGIGNVHSFHTRKIISTGALISNAVFLALLIPEV